MFSKITIQNFQNSREIRIYLLSLVWLSLSDVINATAYTSFGLACRWISRDLSPALLRAASILSHSLKVSCMVVCALCCLTSSSHPDMGASRFPPFLLPHHKDSNRVVDRPSRNGLRNYHQRRRCLGNCHAAYHRGFAG